MILQLAMLSSASYLLIYLGVVLPLMELGGYVTFYYYSDSYLSGIQIFY